MRLPDAYPANAGTGFYVDSLIEHYAMTAREIGQINQLLQSKMAELDQILLTASRVASNLTNYYRFCRKARHLIRECASVRRSVPG